MRLIVLGVCFFATFFLSMSLFGERERRRRRVLTQLDRFVQTRATRVAPAEAGGESASSVRATVRARLAGLIAKLLEGRRSATALGRRLRQAGWKIQPSEFVLISLGAALAGLALSLLLAPDIAARLLLTVLGGAVPYLRLVQRIGARRKLIEAQLVDALSLISNALRSGYSFLQAMDVAARELPEPIAGELEQVLRETRVNISVDAALANMVERTGSQDLDMAVTAIAIQRQVGGNLGEVLDNISNTIRERLRVRGEIRALTAQGRISAWIVGLLPLVLTVVIYLLNREYISVLFIHPVGRFALILAALMESVGVALIRRIIQIEL